MMCALSHSWATIEKRSWRNYKDARMREEARKHDWNMFVMVTTDKELEKTAQKLHEMSPNYIG